jgi:hypothetical protein
MTLFYLKENQMAAPQAVEKQTAKQTAAPTSVAQDSSMGGAPKKVEPVVTIVTMTDGRKVSFVGKRKMLKEVIIADGKVSVRFDLVNGETRTFHVPPNMLLQMAGHGASQKIGDEAAGESDVDDIVVAIDDIISRLNKGEWTATRTAGDGFSGASVVIRAIGEVTGKSAEEVKAFLQKKLDDAKARGEALTRRDLYASFRNPSSKTGQIIKKLEEEKASKSAKFNSDDLLKELK